MGYEVRIVADSIGEHGKRLTTMVVVFPRFILAEVNTHRMLSRNSASSRAIPPERMIERVQLDPFVPETFNRRVKGMGVGEALERSDHDRARETWLNARDKAVAAALALMELDCDKSRINRLLEPFLWHTALISATEWSNFFALRDHPAAQPEFQIIARMMREAMEASTPAELDYGDWHLPFVDQIGKPWDDSSTNYWPMVSAGRCFVVSYDRLDSIMAEDDEVSYARAKSGSSMGHWSPLEHPACCMMPSHGHKFGVVADEDRYANFIGWRQLRGIMPGEHDFQKLLDAKVTT